MNEKLLYTVIGIAILHNGKRYEAGETLELTQEEAQNISLYVALTESAKEKLAQQQRQAEEALQKAKEEEGKRKAEEAKKAKEEEAKRKAEEAKRRAEEKKRQSDTDNSDDKNA